MKNCLADFWIIVRASANSDYTREVFGFDAWAGGFFFFIRWLMERFGFSL